MHGEGLRRGGSPSSPAHTRVQMERADDTTMKNCTELSRNPPDETAGEEALANLLMRQQMQDERKAPQGSVWRIRFVCIDQLLD